jgi:hypothetical protein
MAVEIKQRAEQVSGISNVVYDLMTVLTNKLEGIAAMEEYKVDAQNARDQEVQDLFEQLEQRASEDVRRIKDLLTQRLR